MEKINGNHITPQVFATQEIPDQLHDIKEAFTTWVPPSRKLKVGAMLLEGITRPRVSLAGVWPAFAIWLITDEIYGVKQWLPEDKKLHEVIEEITKLLGFEARSEVFNEKRHVDLQFLLIPFGERLTNEHNPAAGYAWQCVFNCSTGIAPLALRYGIHANIMNQPVEKNVAIRATVNAYLGKTMDLLKL